MADSSFKSQGKQDRYFFDISELLSYIGHFDRYSGIQRVVVALIGAVAKKLPDRQVYLSWLDRGTGVYSCVRFDEIGSRPFASPVSMRQRFFPGSKSTRKTPLLDRYKNAPMKYRFHRTRLDLAVLLNKGDAFRKYGITADDWRAARKAEAKIDSGAPVPHTPIRQIARPGDKLVILDSSWSKRQSDAFADLDAEGVQIFTLVHDLIPIKAPETCDADTPGNYYDWLYLAKDYTHEFMTVSRSTKADLQEFLDAHGTLRKINVLELAQSALPETQEHPGANAPRKRIAAPIATAAYPGLQQIMEMGNTMRETIATPYALCVGTIELRKNMWRTALAWKKLLDDGVTDLPKLVFAGRWGWSNSDFSDFLKGTNNLHGYIKVVESPSDDDLSTLYRNCEFCVMASMYEGWGLPVGEALAYGKTSVVARNSSLPEVGGDLVEYCDAKRVSSIAAAVMKVLDADHRGALEHKIANARLRGWDDVSKDLVSILLAPEPVSTEREDVHPVSESIN